MHKALIMINKSRQADPHPRQIAARQSSFDADPVKQMFHRVQHIGNRGRAWIASDGVIRHLVAGKIHHHGGVFAVRQLHAHHKMCRPPHAQGHSRPAAAMVGVARFGDLFDQARFDQLRGDRGHCGRANP